MTRTRKKIAHKHAKKCSQPTDRPLTADRSPPRRAGECLEAQFDSCAVFGQTMDPSLLGAGAVPPEACRKAPLSPEVQAWAEEVARNEAGHVRAIREALGDFETPCPRLDIDGGFTGLFRQAFGDPTLEWDP